MAQAQIAAEATVNNTIRRAAHIFSQYPLQWFRLERFETHWLEAYGAPLNPQVLNVGTTLEYMLRLRDIGLVVIQGTLHGQVLVRLSDSAGDILDYI